MVVVACQSGQGVARAAGAEAGGIGHAVGGGVAGETIRLNVRILRRLWIAQAVSDFATPKGLPALPRSRRDSRRPAQE